MMQAIIIIYSYKNRSTNRNDYTLLQVKQMLWS